VINANPDIERLRFLVKVVQRETKHLQTTDQRLFELNFLQSLSIAKFIRRETAFMLSMLVLSAIFRYECQKILVSFLLAILL